MPSTLVADHLARHLGPGEHLDEVRAVGLWRHRRPEFVSVATLGLAEQREGGAARPELVCSVRAGQEERAGVLVRAVLAMLGSGSQVLTAGQLVPVRLEGTAIAGVLVATHPFLDEGFGHVREGADTTGEVRAEVLTLVPVTVEEMTFARASGTDALLDAFEKANTPLLDTARWPVVKAPAKRGLLRKG